MNWTARFAEYAGYDCMTHAWVVEGCGQKLYIDCAQFGQKSCYFDDQESITKAGLFAAHVAAALEAFHVEMPAIAQKRTALPAIPSTGHPITQEEIDAAQDDQ